MTKTVGQVFVLSHVEQCAKNAISQSNYNQEIEIKQQRRIAKLKDSAISFQEVYFPKGTAKVNWLMKEMYSSIMSG